MRILFYSSYFYPYTSGITTYPFKIMSQLAKQHKITVLAFNHKINKYEEESINGFKIKRMPFLFKIYKGFISPQSFFYFFNEIKKNDLVVINVPNIEGLPLIVLAKLFNKKVISIFHCFLGLNHKLNLKIINLITNLIITLQLILSDKIVSYTKNYVNSLSIYKIIKKNLLTVLPPILKLPISQTKLREFLRLKKENVWIGYAGRISNEKGLEFLIDAVSLFHHSGEGPPVNRNDFKIVVVFAGPYGKDVVGENSYYLKIKDILEEKKISYKFLGNLNDGNLGAFYKAIDVLVLPSINQTEAFGMVQAEAMLLGTPVVATNLPGVRVPIKLTKMGLLVKPKNSLQLIKAIKKILKNKKKYSNKKLIKHAKRIFNIKKVYQFYEKIINNLNHEKN